MKRPRAVDESGLISIREVTLREIRRLPRIPSGYVTDRVFRLAREVGSGEFSWTLREEKLAHPLKKVYDDGDVDDWLESYAETEGASSMKFAGAFDATTLLGLVTWSHSRWNDTLWLADIRVRPERRRSGAGSHLVRRVQAEAAAVSTRGIRLETQITNYPAIKFYRKHGFIPAGVDDHLYSNRDLEKQEVALFMFWERI
jgi:ribosomal protein S18 acetylase RimI-like enzyme